MSEGRFRRPRGRERWGLRFRSRRRSWFSLIRPCPFLAPRPEALVGPLVRRCSLAEQEPLDLCEEKGAATTAGAPRRAFSLSSPRLERAHRQMRREGGSSEREASSRRKNSSRISPYLLREQVRSRCLQPRRDHRRHHGPPLGQVGVPVASGDKGPGDGAGERGHFFVDSVFFSALTKEKKRGSRLFDAPLSPLCFLCSF